MNLLNTDIYSLVDTVKDLEARYIDEENNENDTLAVGIYRLSMLCLL